MAIYKPDIDKLMANDDVEGLIEALFHEDLVLRKEASRALKYVGNEEATDALVETLRYDSWQDEYSVMGSVRAYAAEALGRIGDKKAVNGLIDALEDPDSEVRWKSAESLGKIKDLQALESLIYSLETDEDEYVRKFAARALGELKDPLATDSLINALKDKEWAVRKSSAQALGRIGDKKALKPLLNVLNDEDVDVRRQAVISLEKMKKHAIKPLLEKLYDFDWQTRAISADALGRIGDRKATMPLAKALSNSRKRDENRYVRGKAAEALGRIGDVRAIPYLEKALEEKYIYVRKRAKDALDLIEISPELEHYENEFFSFDYHNAWLISEINQKGKLLIGFCSKNNIKFSLNIKKDVEDLTADEFADVIIDVFNEQNALKVTKQPLSIAGYSGYEVQSDNFEVDPPSRTSVYIFRSNGDLYYLWFAGKPSDIKNASKYIKITLNSFHLKL